MKVEDPPSRPHDLPRPAPPQLPPLLQRAADLPGGHLAHDDRPHPAGARPDPQRGRDRPARRRSSSVPSSCSARGVAWSPTGPTSAASCSSPRPSRCCSRSRSPRSPSWPPADRSRFYLIALAGGFMLAFDNPARRSFVAEMVPDRRRAERGHPQQRPDDQLARDRTCARRRPGGDGRLRMVLRARRRLLPGGDREPGDDAPSASCASPRSSPRPRGQLRAAVRYIHDVPDLWIPLADDDGRRHADLQLRGRDPAVRRAHAARHQRLVHLAVLGAQHRVGHRCAGRRARDGSSTPVTWCGRRSASGSPCSSSPVHPPCSSAFPIALFVGFTSVAFITTSTAIVQVKADPAMRGPRAGAAGDGPHRQHPDRGPLLGWVCDAYGARVGILRRWAFAAVAAGVWGYVAHRRVDRRRAAERDPSGRAARLTSA